VMNTLAVLCLISSCVLIVRQIMGEPVYFFLNNAAADASAIAFLFPLVAMRPLPPFARNAGLARLLYGLPVIAIGVSGSTTAVAALCLATVVYTVQVRKLLPKIQFKYYLMGGTAALAFTIGMLHIFTPDGVNSDSGRFNVWKISLDFQNKTMSDEALVNLQKRVPPPTLFYLDRTSSLLWGVGAGSFQPLSADVQIANGQHPSVLFPFMHNDWLQVVFEQGLFGALLLLVVGAAAVWKSLARPWLVTALFTYGAVMVTQFPFRYLSSALIGAFLLAEAFKGDLKE
jgi:O-antigen ligase